jgi:hypothetical protein
LASSTTKKVQLWRFDRQPIAGYVNPGTYITENGVELLTLAGNVIAVPFGELKAVCFVREFDRTPPVPPKRSFVTRPKLDGLWIRLTLRDGQQIEGVMPNDLLSISGHGFLIAPADFAGNNQRVFIPRPAVVGAQVLGVVGSPLRQPARKKATTVQDQIRLFEDAG